MPVLSAEEAHILILLGRGLDHPQIEHDHGIPVRDSRLHVRSAVQKLGAANPLHAYALAVGRQLIPPDTAIQE